jgi:predicted DNA-binding antitoxin AbrB/MazE fold protein
MSTTVIHSQIRAVHHKGVLELLDPVELPEGAEVRLFIQSRPSEVADVRLRFPTRLVSAEKLDSLTGLIQVGGDALADSEALYDPRCN